MRGNPGPGYYEVRKMMTKEEEAEIYSQRRQKIDCSKVPKRPFFMDEIVKRNRALPAPG
jgi:hypothetical protein